VRVPSLKVLCAALTFHSPTSTTRLLEWLRWGTRTAQPLEPVQAKR
jgi:hypothetical protein